MGEVEAFGCVRVRVRLRIFNAWVKGGGEMRFLEEHEMRARVGIFLKSGNPAHGRK